MTHPLDSRNPAHDYLTRRQLLRLGGAGALGLGLGQWSWASQPSTIVQRPASAKACIFVFLFGSPPQHETFDPKPDAPREVQGEMGAIDTALPGLRICEGLPRIAQVADRLTVVRSMTHDYPVHCCAYVMSGMPAYSVPLETQPRNPQHWPFMGSVVDYLDGLRTGIKSPDMPRNIGLPWRFCSRGSSPNQAGPYAAFLGSSYDPFWTDFDGTGTKVVPKLNADTQKVEVRDPHAGIEPHARFLMGSGCTLPDEVPDRRFSARRALLAQVDAARPELDQLTAVAEYSDHQQRAFSLIGTNRMRAALDVQREKPSLRERYGMTLFGQSCLAARRLVEAGARFVTVFWDPFGPHGASVWDTHSNHFPRLKEYLLPVFDQGFAALIEDLDNRGLLDETLVVCTSEHGRTPKIDSKPTGGARHHWSKVYSTVFAGGGIARGRVVGRSDATGGEVADTPISPKDMQATIYGLLGYDERTIMFDRQRRPLPIAGSGHFRPELLG
mgnify:FL=1